MELTYYRHKTINKAICLQDKAVYFSYECHRYDNGSEQVRFVKKFNPVPEGLEKELNDYKRCEQEEYENVMRDFFCKVKEYRNAFEATKLNPRYW